MVRPFAAIACLLLVSGFTAADEPLASRLEAHRAEHKRERSIDPDESMTRLKRMLWEIIDTQNRLSMEREPPIYPPASRRLDPVIGAVPLIHLKKGQRIKVEQTIEWCQYGEENLPVWFRASDPSLQVPDKLELNFETHQFRFAYEIKAGNKVGEFTVTVTPTPGKAVEVKVIVK